jgi:hypothetical protein
MERAMKQARAGSLVGKFEKLLEEERRWRRKATLAQGKLLAVRKRIDGMGLEMAREQTQTKTVPLVPISKVVQ